MIDAALTITYHHPHHITGHTCSEGVECREGGRDECGWSPPSHTCKLTGLFTLMKFRKHVYALKFYGYDHSTVIGGSG